MSGNFFAAESFFHHRQTTMNPLVLVTPELQAAGLGTRIFLLLCKW